MKKEISPGAIVAIIGVLVLAIAAFFIFGGGGGAGTEKVDLKKLDPKDLRDDEPIKRGQPGYRERTTDPVTG
jgi:hypothetical protein